MSFSAYNPYDRYKKRSAKRISRFIIFSFIFTIIFGIGYWVGGMRYHQKIYILEEQNKILIEENSAVKDDIVSMRAEAQTANVRLEQLKASYNELLSDGDMRDIVKLVRKQIEQGVDAQRLKSVIISARPPQNCSDPKSKRFIVVTPVYKGPSSVASINGVIFISGTGVSSKNDKGNKEAWFDARQPVKITFKEKGKEPEYKEGVLPIHHSMIIGDKEYRFTITKGAKSFAKVTFDYCDYP